MMQVPALVPPERTSARTTRSILPYHLCVILPCHPLARICPFGDPVGRRSLQVSGLSRDRLHRSAKVRSRPYIKCTATPSPPAHSIGYDYSFPPSPECVVPDFLLSRLGTPSLCICVTSRFACRCASVEYESALDFRPR